MHINLLDNIFWHALSGSHQAHSVGGPTARRYAPGFPPLVAFAQPEQPDWAALTGVCAPGEALYCGGWSGAAPQGWQILVEGLMTRMVWQGAMPDEDTGADIVPLGAPNVAQAVALAELTKPGPFGPRNLELGDYMGCFDNGQLVAMAGERAFAPPFREVSGVCTHPSQQGRGLARRLVQVVIRRQVQRGETPFLHVMSSNLGALGLYQRMGFAAVAQSVVRVVARG